MTSTPANPDAPPPAEPVASAGTEPQPITADAIPRGADALSPFAQEFVAPRLGIVHFLIWMAVTAVLLKLKLAYLATLPSSIPERWNLVLRVQILASEPLCAAGFVGLGVLALARRHGAAGRLQPGHWIMLVTATISLVWYAWWCMSFLASNQAGVSPSYGEFLAMWLPYVTTPLFGAVIYSIATFRATGGLCWKWSLRMLAVSQTVLFTASLLTLVQAVFLTGLFRGYGIAYCWLFSEVEGAIVFVAAAVDLARRARRDWLHWLGIVLVEGGAVLGIAMQICTWLFP